MPVTIDDIEKIKDVVSDAKNKSTKAEGAKERLVNQLNEDFDIESETDIDPKIKEIEESISKDEKRLDKVLVKLNEIHDWDDE